VYISPQSQGKGIADFLWATGMNLFLHFLWRVHEGLKPHLTARGDPKCAPSAWKWDVLGLWLLRARSRSGCGSRLWISSHCGLQCLSPRRERNSLRCDQRCWRVADAILFHAHLLNSYCVHVLAAIKEQDSPCQGPSRLADRLKERMKSEQSTVWQQNRVACRTT
jgi:hypothetical protein